jgi:hypothetical protein
MALCKEIYRIQTEDSSHENLPNPKILYRMLKDLIVNQRDMKKEIDSLKSKLNAQQKKNIISWLNEVTHKQSRLHENIQMGFSKWASNFSINSKNVSEVFEGDIIEGIKSVLIDKISCSSNDKKILTVLPIRAFSQKPNHLYIYDTVKCTSTDDTETFPNDEKSLMSEFKSKGKMTAWTWKNATNEDIEKMIEPIRRKLLMEFTQWQIKNRELIDSSDEMKEKEIEYILGFNSVRISLEKRIETIKKWMYNYIKDEQDFSSIDFS